MRAFLLKTLRLLAAWVGVFLVMALMVEGVSRILFPYVPPSPWDYRSGRPPAYEKAPYFSQPFVDEAFSHQKWINPPGTRIIYPGNYHSRWFNVQDGVRVTVGAPASGRRVLLIGSSTVYNAEVPDNFTITSLLQELINTRAESDLAILNYGASGVKASQQLERLRTLELRPDDIVVFYDGTADAMQGVFYANFDGWIVGENRKRLDNLIARRRVEIEAVARRSRFFNWLYARSTNYLPEHLTRPEKIAALAADTSAKFINDIVAADQYVRSKGATFIHVLQPDLFTRPLRDFERPLVANHFLTMNGVDIALLAAHKEMAAVPLVLSERGIKSYDATMLFDSIAEPIFFDFAHTNELGNREIANFLFGVLMTEGLASRRDAAEVGQNRTGMLR